MENDTKKHNSNNRAEQEMLHYQQWPTARNQRGDDPFHLAKIKLNVIQKKIFCFTAICISCAGTYILISFEEK